MADAQPTYDDLTLWGELERIKKALTERVERDAHGPIAPASSLDYSGRIVKAQAILDEMFGRLAGA